MAAVFPVLGCVAVLALWGWARRHVAPLTLCTGVAMVGLATIAAGALAGTSSEAAAVVELVGIAAGTTTVVVAERQRRRSTLSDPVADSSTKSPLSSARQ